MSNIARRLMAVVACVAFAAASGAVAGEVPRMLMGANPAMAWTASRAGVAVGRPAQPRYHPERVLVRFKPRRSEAVRRLCHDRARATRVIRSHRFVEGLEVVQVPTGQVESALAWYRADPNVSYAEPDYTVELAALPNDPFFDLLWGMRNVGQDGEGVFCFPTSAPGVDIRAAQAWNVWTGSADFKIAIIDTGINYLHPDLAPNVWINEVEIPGNGIDDDGNGWIDDVHGYDFFNLDPDPMDDNGHGSHVAGTIGAAGDNGLGVVGLNWQCQLVALKMFPASGEGSNISEAIAALEYVVAQGIRVSNNSWGFSGAFSQALYDAIEATQAVGHVFVAAAGNDFGLNIDRFPRYPAAYDLPNILSVTAVDNRGHRATFANRGPSMVDLAAPGACVFSTRLGDQYGYSDGTSMAAPHVTGAVALAMTRFPDDDWRKVIARIVQTAMPLPDLTGITLTGGLLDAAGAVGDCNANGVFDAEDIAQGTSADCAGNGIPDECERDCNANSRADSCDVFWGISSDCNANGIPDECENDCNQNDLADDCERSSPNVTNCNRNAVPDECEISIESAAPGGPFFCTENCDDDCNANGTLDSCDLAEQLSEDCALNGIPDECEPDCNGNGIANSCDILSGRSDDCSRNRIPDECEPDCNGNGAADSCDIRNGIVEDCNQDGIPDECQTNQDDDCNANAVPDSCDVLDAFSLDCNSNARPDECDVTSGASLDVNGNQIPDECDGKGIVILPVSSTGAHVIEGQEIRLSGGGHRVTFEARVSGWDLDRDGDPRLLAYQIQIGAAGFDNGVYEPVRFAALPCTADSDCGDFHSCTPAGVCEAGAALIIDPRRKDYAFADFISLRISNAGAAAPDIWMVGALFNEEDAVADDGLDKYAGTIMVDVPSLTGGAYHVEPVPHGSVYREEAGVPITVPTRIGARIVVEPDCNGNGVADSLDIAVGDSEDCNDNAIPDECLALEEDCNGNVVPDECDIATGQSSDCNANGVPDECIERELDCDGNRIPDACDIQAGTHLDCNANDIPDLCDMETGASRDCNENGIPDECIDFERDCNENGRPDDCDLGLLVSADCNANGTPDECDIASHQSLDEDANGVPDECQTLRRVPEEFATIQEAIDAANPGDTVLVGDGVYRGEGNFALNFWGKPIIVKSRGGPERTVIDCGQEWRGVHFVNRERESSQLIGFTIARGLADFGGGIYCRRSSPTIRNCRILGNMARFRGGGVFCDGGSNPLLERCVLAGNLSLDEGGAIACDFQSNPPVRQCLLIANQADRDGGAIHCDNLAQPVFTNCTIVWNTAQRGAGIFCTRRVLGTITPWAPVIENSILWGNQASGGGHQVFLTVGTELTVSYSTVQPGPSSIVTIGSADLRWLNGNLQTYPFFADPLGQDLNPFTWSDNDLRLSLRSPCVDAGLTAAIASSGQLDLAGGPRVRCGAVDMGAYEGSLGDADCNRSINLLDYAFWPPCMGVEVAADGSSGCDTFDFDASGTIDLRDFAQMQRSIHVAD